MKQPVRIAAEWLTAIGLLLIGQTALAADSQCPDGQFGTSAMQNKKKH